MSVIFRRTYNLIIPPYSWCHVNNVRALLGPNYKLLAFKKITVIFQTFYMLQLNYQLNITQHYS